jgi:hypothetical protein
MIITGYPTLPRTDLEREIDQKIRNMWPDGYDTARFGWGTFIRLFPDLAGRYYNGGLSPNPTQIWLYGDYIYDLKPIRPLNISHALVNGTTFSESDLRWADLSHAVFNGCEFIRCNLSAANVLYSTFIDCGFWRCDTSGVNWGSTNLMRRVKHHQPD